MKQPWFTFLTVEDIVLREIGKKQNVGFERVPSYATPALSQTMEHLLPEGSGQLGNWIGL